MMVGIPMFQLILFGYAINSDPKHLPTAVYSADNSVFSRTIVWAHAQQQLLRHHARAAERGGNPATARARPQCNSPWKFLWTFRANYCAANSRICCSKPMRPIPTAVGYAIARDEFADADGFESRPDRTAGKTARPVPRRSTSLSTSTTTPKTSRSITSCPDSWA